MSAHIYSEILNGVLEQVQQLTPEEQIQMLRDLEIRVRENTAKPRHSIMELKGLGKELWQEIDVQEYINQERASWGGWTHCEEA